MEIVCRRAKPADLPQIVLLLKAMHEEMPVFPVVDRVVMTKISRMIEQAGVFVVEHGSIIIGSVGLDRQKWWSTDQPYFRSRWVFVAKRFRRSKAAHHLLKAVKAYADEVSLLVVMEIFAFDQVDRKNRLYRRYFTPIGERFVSGLEHMKD